MQKYFVINVTLFLFLYTLFGHAQMNFSLADTNTMPESGEAYCYSHYPKLLVCVPMANNSKVQLRFSIKGYPFQMADPGQVIPLKGNQLIPGNAVEAMVVNPQTDKTLFVGYIYNHVGLICDSKTCHTWL